MGTTGIFLLFNCQTPGAKPLEAKGKYYQLYTGKC